MRESLDERKREAGERRSAQAARVFVSQADGVFVADDPSEMSEMLDEDADSWTDITKAEAEARRRMARCRTDCREQERAARLRRPTSLAPRFGKSRLAEPAKNGHAWR
jgi:hypothetical protein